MRRELQIFAALAGVFAFAYFVPLSDARVSNAILEAFRMLQWYARNHTLACVVPAMFIAGGIAAFLSKETVLRHLGAKANRVEAYGVASVSGTVLAVCSCSVLPMFAGIYKLGAGLGPATAFLYSGPAINILAIFLSARVLGFQLGAARAIGAVVFSVVLGLLMVAIFRKSEKAKVETALQTPEPERPKRSLAKTALFLACMVLFLVFSDWFNPGHVVVNTTDGRQFAAVIINETRDAVRFQVEEDTSWAKNGDKVMLPKSEIAGMQEVESWVMTVYHIRWYLSALMGIAVVLMAWRWYEWDEIRTWMNNTWDFAKLLVPLLYGGVFVVGFVSVLLPEKQVAQWVGDNSLSANLVASVIGAFWYFATLTEIPITQALLNLGMSKGPALALLLAGPALSLPNMLVIRKVMGTKKMLVFTTLVVVMSTATGIIFGALAS